MFLLVLGIYVEDFIKDTCCGQGAKPKRVHY